MGYQQDAAGIHVRKRGAVHRQVLDAEPNVLTCGEFDEASTAAASASSSSSFASSSPASMSPSASATASASTSASLSASVSASASTSPSSLCNLSYLLCFNSPSFLDFMLSSSPGHMCPV